MTIIIVKLDDELVNKRQKIINGVIQPIEEVVYDAFDFYLFLEPTDRKYIKVEKIEE